MAVLVGALTLSVVFAVAGVAKLLDGPGSRTAAREFGVPGPLVGLAGVGLPLLELAISILLLPAATRQAGAIAALVMLLVFCAAIGRAMVRGEAPACHCFGQLHSTPAGWGTLARNAVLAGVAAFVAVGASSDPGPGAFAWLGELGGVAWLVVALGVVLALVLAVGGYAVVHVIRSYGRVLVRLEAVEERLRVAGFALEEPDDVPQLGLEPGTPAPSFWLPSVDGPRVALGDLLAPGVPVLLLFTSPSCEPCAKLMPAVAEWQREHADVVTVALLSAGEPERVRADAAEHGLVRVLLDEDLSAYEAFGANGTPSAVLVGDDGTVAAWLAAGTDWIESLFEQALHGVGRTPGLPVGAEVPALGLARLDGGETTVSQLVAGPTVVLFWNPGCGYCRAMHDDVRTWEAAPGEGAPALVVVSAGELEDVRAEGFASPVLLDPDWVVAGAFGADGTPMAVLVDAEGRIGAPVVSGAVDALALLGADALSSAD